VTDPLPRLHQIAQHADDLDRAVAFYRDVLDFPLVARFDPPGLAFFDLGNVRLLVQASAPSAILYIEVPDITARRDGLVEQGVEFVDEPHMIYRDADGTFGPAGTEEWMTFFRDSEGNLVGLVERRSSDSGS
jgi:methylmalonyl-CoA/ethylmalonyl-CoA epimerase